MDFKSIPNPTLGDVPDDVFRYVMFPYMDYDSRINFNQVMPPDWRVSRKFKEYSTLSHDVYTLTNTIRDAMDKVLGNGDVNGRALAMANMFNLCARPRMLAFIGRHENLREALLGRTEDYSDVDRILLTHASEESAKILSAASIELRSKIMNTALVPMQLNFKLEPISVV
jgi:hypothetical protein